MILALCTVLMGDHGFIIPDLWKDVKGNETRSAAGRCAYIFPFPESTHKHTGVRSHIEYTITTEHHSVEQHSSEQTNVGKDEITMEQRNLYAYLPEGVLTMPQLLTGIADNQHLPVRQIENQRLENQRLTSSLHGLETAYALGKTIEGTCTLCDCQTMQLTVQFGMGKGKGIRGILPRDEVCYGPEGTPVKDIAILTRVGKPIQCRVTGFAQDENGETVVQLSRKRAQYACYQEVLRHLRPGDILSARVTHMESFGAFLDIGCGMIALATVDSLSVSRIAHPKDRFSVGQCIWAVVRQNDPATGRIYMSTRELLGTWHENAAAFAPAQTVPGIIRSVEDYGIFVELTPNLAGLAEPYRHSEGHRSDSGRSAEPAAREYRPGEGCAVYIKSILPERMKIKLVLIDRCDPPKRPALQYYLPTDTWHIDHWRYAPASCDKKIETDFGTLSYAK